MLTKQHRYSFRNGVPRNSIQSPYFVLRFEKTQDFSCGFVISKKVASLAVDRNRIKRLYRSILGDIVKKTPLPYSLVFYIRKKSIDVGSNELRHHIEQIFKKEGIM